MAYYLGIIYRSCFGKGNSKMLLSLEHFLCLKPCSEVTSGCMPTHNPEGHRLGAKAEGYCSFVGNLSVGEVLEIGTGVEAGVGVEGEAVVGAEAEARAGTRTIEQTKLFLAAQY